MTYALFCSEEMLRQAEEIQRQENERMIMREEREKEQQRSTIHKKVKTAKKFKNYISFVKGVGTFVEGVALHQARKNGKEEEVRAAGFGNLFDFVDYVVDDCNNDIEKLTEKLSKLE